MARKLSQKIDDLAHNCRGRQKMTIQEIFDLMDMAVKTFIVLTARKPWPLGLTITHK